MGKKKMEATQVDFFPTRLSIDSLVRLVILDSRIVVGKCSRLAVWLDEFIDAERERRDTDGRFEPGCPVIDYQRPIPSHGYSGGNTTRVKWVSCWPDNGNAARRRRGGAIGFVSAPQGKCPAWLRPPPLRVRACRFCSHGQMAEPQKLANVT